jgi:hypothetical protein
MAAPEQLPSQVGSALDELRATLDRAAELAKEIGSRPESPAELSARLADVQSDRDELSTKLAEYEQQVGRLMNLYVATYQLHATLDPGEVQATIAEIAINLLGAERFVLLFWKNDGNEPTSECEVAFAQGMEDDKSGLYPDGCYRGGDPAVDATLSDGVLRIGPRGWARWSSSSSSITRPCCGPRTAICSTSSRRMLPPRCSRPASIRPRTGSSRPSRAWSRWCAGNSAP